MATGDSSIDADRIVEKAEAFVRQVSSAKRHGDARANGDIDSARRAGDRIGLTSEDRATFQRLLRDLGSELRALTRPDTSGSASGQALPLLNVEYVPYFIAAEIVRSAATEASRVVVSGIGSSLPNVSIQPRPWSAGNQRGPVDMWRLEDGGTVRLLLGERDGILPWLVITVDATRSAAEDFALEFGAADFGLDPGAVGSERRR